MSLNRLWSALAVDTCVARGSTHFFLAPGSRCTPLTLAIAQHAEATVTQHFDERALAFSALGFARATGKPGVFVCTSGTAVANAFPAVIEASIEHVPMVLLTADRPPELRETGSNQTIDQLNMFGKYTSWFYDMPCPTSDISPDFVRSQLDYAIERAGTGPVQINCMFREPFEVSDAPLDLSAYPRRRTRSSPVPRVEINVLGGDTLVVVGGCRLDEAFAARRLAERLSVPLLSDICSGLRHISTELPADRDLPKPNTVIHVGGRIVSKSWHAQLAKYAAHVIHLNSNRNRLDPYHMGMERVLTPLAGIHESVSLTTPSSKSFLASWEQAEQRRRVAIEAVLASELPLSEPSIAYALAPRIPLGQGLFIGNSLPIRDFDRYGYWEPEQRISVGANRGASGIDGLIATSVGFAEGLRSPTTVVVGDLSALHDLNSLALVRQSEVPIIVVIMNNHGGGIFDLLPVAKQTNHFERFFTTPHQLSFSHVASMFDIAYERPPDMTGFLESYQRAVASNSSTIIEVVTDRAYNAQVRQKIHAEISQ